ncbi:MAG: acyl carrier protein [Armatimonadota bacterium]
MEERIKRIMSAVLRIDDDAIGPDTRAENTASWDSLGQMNLAVALEQEFDIEIPVDDIMALKSYSVVVACVQRLLGYANSFHMRSV